MTCFDLEILLADYVEGTIPAEQRTAVESHLSTCADCAALAHDGAQAVVFMERAAAVEPPPELVARILLEMNAGPGRSMVNSWWASRWFRNRWFRKWLEPVFEPRFAMGMAMTLLSFAMVGHLPGVRQWKLADLNPVNVWVAAENRVQRTWERAVKNYESTPLVFEIQAQLHEWDQLNEWDQWKEWDEDPSAGAAGGAQSR